MEASSTIFQPKLPPPPNHPSLSPSSRNGFSCPTPTVSLLLQHRISLKGTVFRHGQMSKHSRLNCAKGGNELMENINEELVQEVIGMGTLSEKCKEIGGIVELLECLEREAIMGEDVGRDPTDYNRRAQIFAKSSRVFQAIKDSTTTTTTSG